MDRRERLNDPLVAMLAAFSGLQARLWTALPGIVQSYDAAKMTVVVQPAIKAQQLFPDGSKSWVTLPLLLDCPVMFPTGGGFTLTFPIAAGDEVLVVFASRCIDAWWESGGVQTQLEFRMHDLSDGFAIPGPRSQPRVLSNVSTDTVQLRRDNGSTYIELDGSNNINIVAPASVNVSSPQVVVTGGDVIADGISLKHHTHPGVEPGAGSTGEPS